ncbi:MAG: rubrerythrin [Marinilabiliales bacterium]|nr:MAG: rubrerythrin [Marinilabiliales bacterium]
MNQTKTLEILKTAILLEKKGKAFYTHMAEQSKEQEVKQFFKLMADEEEEHIRFLSEQFSHYIKTNEFKMVELPAEETTDEEILSEKLKEKLTAASFEAAAISAAIDFENRAIAVYQGRADQSLDPVEKAFYKWLADWEKGHHKLLLKLDEDLREKIWNDNNFWPF